jgi:hypothetical protein
MRGHLQGGAMQGACGNVQRCTCVDCGALPRTQVVAAKYLDRVARGQIVAVSGEDANQAAEFPGGSGRPGGLIRADGRVGVFHVLAGGSQEVPENGSGHYPSPASSLLT